jgi:hypothetical protein
MFYPDYQTVQILPYPGKINGFLIAVKTLMIAKELYSVDFLVLAPVLTILYNIVNEQDL